MYASAQDISSCVSVCYGNTINHHKIHYKKEGETGIRPSNTYPREGTKTLSTSVRERVKTGSNARLQRTRTATCIYSNISMDSSAQNITRPLRSQTLPLTHHPEALIRSLSCRLRPACNNIIHPPHINQQYTEHKNNAPRHGNNVNEWLAKKPVGHRKHMNPQTSLRSCEQPPQLAVSHFTTRTQHATHHDERGAKMHSQEATDRFWTTKHDFCPTIPGVSLAWWLSAY